MGSSTRKHKNTHSALRGGGRSTHHQLITSACRQSGASLSRLERHSRGAFVFTRGLERNKSASQQKRRTTSKQTLPHDLSVPVQSRGGATRARAVRCAHDVTRLRPSHRSRSLRERNTFIRRVTHRNVSSLCRSLSLSRRLGPCRLNGRPTRAAHSPDARESDGRPRETCPTVRRARRRRWEAPRHSHLALLSRVTIILLIFCIFFLLSRGPLVLARLRTMEVKKRLQQAAPCSISVSLKPRSRRSPDRKSSELCPSHV